MCAVIASHEPLNSAPFCCRDVTLSSVADTHTIHHLQICPWISKMVEQHCWWFSEQVWSEISSRERAPCASACCSALRRRVRSLSSSACVCCSAASRSALDLRHACTPNQSCGTRPLTGFGAYCAAKGDVHVLYGDLDSLPDSSTAAGRLEMASRSSWHHLDCSD